MVVRAITDSLGKEICNKALVVLTHAQFSPPDGWPYDEYFSKRSEDLLKAVRQDAWLKKDDTLVSSIIPVVLVENSGRCNKDETDEKVNHFALWNFLLSSSDGIWYSLVLSHGNAVVRELQISTDKFTIV